MKKLENTNNDLKAEIKIINQNVNEKLNDFKKRTDMELRNLDIKIERYFDKINIYEMDLKNQNNELLENVDEKIKKRIYEYHTKYLNQKMEFDNILTKNQDVLDKIKKKTDIVKHLENEIKSNLKEDIFTYQKEIKSLINNKQLQKELNCLNKSSTTVLNNLLLNKNTIDLIKSLKHNIDESLTSMTSH